MSGITWMTLWIIFIIYKNKKTMAFNINVNEALELPTDTYNRFIETLFANANDDAHVSLMKKMFKRMFKSDKLEFIEYCEEYRKKLTP